VPDWASATAFQKESCRSRSEVDEGLGKKSDQGEGEDKESWATERGKWSSHSKRIGLKSSLERGCKIVAG